MVMRMCVAFTMLYFHVISQGQSAYSTLQIFELFVCISKDNNKQKVWGYIIQLSVEEPTNPLWRQRRRYERVISRDIMDARFPL